MSLQKSYAIKNYSDEIINYTSYIGCVASIIMRFATGAFVDKFGPYWMMLLGSILNVLIMVLFNYFLDVLWLYYITIALIFSIHAMNSV